MVDDAHLDTFGDDAAVASDPAKTDTPRLAFFWPKSGL